MNRKSRYLFSRDPGSTPAEESQRALSKFNLAGKGASHCSFQQRVLEPAGSQSLSYSTLPTCPLKWVLNSQFPSKGPFVRALQSPGGNTSAEFSLVPGWATEGHLRLPEAWTGHGDGQRERERN